MEKKPKAVLKKRTIRLYFFAVLRIHNKNNSDNTQSTYTKQQA